MVCCRYPTDIVSDSAITTRSSKSQKWPKAGVIKYNALISVSIKGRQWQRALDLFEEMQSHGLQADVITYNATISACGQGRQWQRAVGLFEEMQSHGLQANVITYNATIS